MMHFLFAPRSLAFICALLLGCGFTQAADLSEKRWSVVEVNRTAWVWVPELEEGERAPLVFVWHGHGGKARGTSRGFRTHVHWPEAIVVYPQGLKTAGLYDPEGKRSGWETRGKAEENKDLKKLLKGEVAELQVNVDARLRAQKRSLTVELKPLSGALDQIWELTGMAGDQQRQLREERAAREAMYASVNATLTKLKADTLKLTTLVQEDLRAKIQADCKLAVALENVKDSFVEQPQDQAAKK